MAAVAVGRQNYTSSLLLPASNYSMLGGMMAGGLGHSDVGDARVISGLIAEVFERIGKKYGFSGACYNFEPHIASEVFQEMLVEANVDVQHVPLYPNVETNADKIVAVHGVHGEVFVDATYEGDLIASVEGVDWVSGREPGSQYGESEGGVRPPAFDDNHYQFIAGVDARNTSTGEFLWGIQGESPGTIGSGDSHVQSYCYRLCMTTNTSSSLPITKPANYDTNMFELLRRYLKANPSLATLDSLVTHYPINPSRNKEDWNNRGPMGLDFVGASWEFPTANQTLRQIITEQHIQYTRSYLYFLATDPSLPPSLRDAVSAYGYCADEWDGSEIPPQLYVREGRRLVGDVVFTQQDRTTNTLKNDTVGVGSYNMDNHQTFRYAPNDSWTLNEGWLTKNYNGLFEMPYSLLLPKISSIQNLLAPVPVSASHVAYDAIRLEPQWAQLGQVAGVAACHAIRQNSSVQTINITSLQAALRADGIITHISNVPPKPPAPVCEFSLI